MAASAGFAGAGVTDSGTTTLHTVDTTPARMVTVVCQRRSTGLMTRDRFETYRNSQIFPLILLPIYTRCPTACIANVDQLKTALSGSSADPRQFRVLLFSFDASDAPEKLSAYRVRERIPLGWFVGAGTQQNIDALLESIGFKYGRARTEFTHPNVVFFLDSKLRIATWIYGTDYSGGDVDRALKVAAGESDWISQHSEGLYTLLLLASSVLCVALVYYLAQLTIVRRTKRETQVAFAETAIELDGK